MRLISLEFYEVQIQVLVFSTRGWVVGGGSPQVGACRERKLFRCREDKETMSVYPRKSTSCGTTNF